MIIHMANTSRSAYFLNLAAKETYKICTGLGTSKSVYKNENREV